MSTLITDKELLALQKPAQYLGGERNSVTKDLTTIDLRFALAFPDTYEVGMSHLGLQILYKVLNDQPNIWGERVYMPLRDMESVLRKTKAPLFSLESRTPLKDFDLIGFSLQYELCGTNIVSMLELGGVPVWASERGESDPLVIAGGPYTHHPEAISPFFDIMFLGDAEEGILDICNIYLQNKHLGRDGLLRALSQVEGVYIPKFYHPHYDEHGNLLRYEAEDGIPQVVTRRLLPTLEGAPFPSRPIVPNIQTIHNRLSVEVMRGCVRGCRFCQAGYLYRPQRERPPEDILKLVADALPETGFEEVSLLSLSTADYCSIVPVLKALMDRYGEGDKLSISFPSTRVDALTPEILEQVQRVRRTNFTVAPEAGTQRLREVINKGVSDDQIMETCRNVFKLGWSGIKLYFMLGLPTETEEDLQGIIETARRIKALPEAKGKDIVVSVSNHVPKPHTPFQWARQISRAEIIEKQRFLAEGCRRARVTFRYHDAFSSFLEGVFCRGDREIAKVVYRAYELGARLDAWTDELNEEIWGQAFSDCGIDPSYYLRERSVEEALPWDHLSCGISKDYFAKEYKRALRDHTTPDCLHHSCSICGACNYDWKRNVLWPRGDYEDLTKLKDIATYSLPQTDAQSEHRFRVRYLKVGALRYLGHLELVQIINRTARRAGIPLSFTNGYRPSPKMSFGPPLQLGIESQDEYMDITIRGDLDAEDLMSRLNNSFPPDIQILEAREIPLNYRSLQHDIRAYRYEVNCLEDGDGTLANYHGGSLSKDELLSIEIFRTQRGGETKRFSLTGNILPPKVITMVPLRFEFTQIVDSSRAQPKPIEIVKALTGLEIGSYELLKRDTIFAEATNSSLVDHEISLGS